LVRFIRVSRFEHYCQTANPQIKEDEIQTDVYQATLLHQEFDQAPNIVILVKTNLKTQARGHIILFSSDLELSKLQAGDSHKMNEQRKIMVIGGLHGDETLGIDLVNRIRNEPIAGIDAIFGNPMATAVNTRYIDRDLNRVSGDLYKQFNFDFQNFESISSQDKLNLGISEELEMYSIFVNPDLFAGNYCALVEKTSLPTFPIN
jgi:Succinylglutamate desuccinylase / Aspartoacylase family